MLAQIPGRPRGHVVPLGGSSPPGSCWSFPAWPPRCSTPMRLRIFSSVVLLRRDQGTGVAVGRCSSWQPRGRPVGHDLVLHQVLDPSFHRGGRFIFRQLSSTNSAMRWICIGVMRAFSSTESLALVMAAMILARSKITSVPFRLMTFMISNPTSRKLSYVDFVWLSSYHTKYGV